MYVPYCTRDDVLTSVQNTDEHNKKPPCDPKIFGGRGNGERKKSQQKTQRYKVKFRLRSTVARAKRIAEDRRRGRVREQETEISHPTFIRKVEKLCVATSH